MYIKNKFINMDGTPYNMSKLIELEDFPMQIFYSDQDLCTNFTDVERLIGWLPKSTRIEFVKGWGHLDFIWSENAKSLAFDKIINFLKDVERN
jgi:hypothetical protein